MNTPTVRTEASVVVTEPISGSRRAFSRQAKPTDYDTYVGARDEWTVTVNSEALAVARELCGPDQRIILISATVVEIVNRSNARKGNRS